MNRADKIAEWLADRVQRNPRNTLEGREDGSTPRVASLVDIFSDLRHDPSGCMILEHRVKLQLFLPTPQISADALASELRLLYGIGTRYSKQLRDDGYATIDSLREHPRWGKASASLLERWGSPPNAGEVYRYPFALTFFRPPWDPVEPEQPYRNADI